MEPRKKNSFRKPAPISEKTFQQLEKRFGFSIADMKKMAAELRFGRPRLEMHLICLTTQTKGNFKLSS
jgi:hypothetical protein